MGWDAELPDVEEALPNDIAALLRRQQIRVRQTHSDADAVKLRFDKSWEYRAKRLPLDVAQEVAFLENLLGRIDNYDVLSE